MIYSVIIVLVVAVVLSGMSLIAANRAARSAAEEARRASELSLCKFIVGQVERYKQEPPSTPAGKEQLEGMIILTQDFRCYDQ
jgi:hypothetical protein